MNMTNELQIQTTIQSHVLDRFIITMEIKHCNILSSRIMTMQHIIKLSM
jgi:hypothetical protein